MVHVPLNGISEFSKLLLVGLGKRAKAQKGIAIVLFTIACILGSASGLPLISSSGSSTALAQTQDARIVEGDRFFQQGVQQFHTKQFQAALQSFQQALEIYREIGNRKREAYLLAALGGVCNILNQYQQAINFYQQALPLLREIGDRQWESITLAGMGKAYDSQGQYQQALEHYQQALAIRRKIGDQAGEGTSVNNIGEIYDRLGQYQPALEHYRQALAIHRKLGNRQGEGISTTGIGLIQYYLGQYPQALEHLQQALIITRELGDRAGEGTILSNIGGVYSELGQYRQALEYYRQALPIRREAGNRAELGQTINNIGGVYFYLGQYQQALEYYQQALAIYRELGNQAVEGTIVNNIGGVYYGLGQYEQALEYLQQALPIRREADDRPGQGETLNNIGMIYYRLRQYPQALEYLQQALAIQRRAGNPAEQGTTLNNIGVVFFLSNQLTAAENTLFEALALLESLRASKLSDTDNVALFDKQVNTYKVLQQTLITQNKTESALEVAERGRARAFVELLAARLYDLHEGKTFAKAPDLPAIRRIAQQRDATLVQYSVIDSGVSAPALYIWVIQPTGVIHFRSVDLTTLDRPLSDLVTTSREAIGARNRSEPATIVPEPTPEAQQRKLAQQRQKLQQLYQLLIEPIAQYLPSNSDERVIFIPQGELFLVPFPALVDAQDKYLIEKHTILTAPSIQVLDLTRQQRKSIRANSGSPIQGDNVLVVGNPIMPRVWNPAKGIEEQLSSLPGAEEEAVTVAKEFATKPLLWEQASESAVVQRMPQARIIHLSTHGLLEYGSPQDSGMRDFPGAIALSPSSKDDGLLTSAEILQMKLKAELVVLSACDTGRGRITGDGVIGLSRSLITAGVPSVIVSLWSVPDAPTADLMSEFYRQWQQNPDKAKALRQAMLITMQNHPNPRDWAAFTLIGESE
jgi:CHAT domain-containing protein